MKQPLTDQLAPHLPAGLRLLVGTDTVQVSKLNHSLQEFGQRFIDRLFTDGEQLAAARVAGGHAERLAARFAAKEAAIKAFGLTESGIDWRDIEVERLHDGQPRLRLHGKAARLVRAMGATQIALSLSHDGDQACATVVALATYSQQTN